jgi:hypothetical protein
VWAKKIRGKLHYFGPWDDPDGALGPHMSSVYREPTSDQRLKAVTDHVRTWFSRPGRRKARRWAASAFGSSA